MYWIYIYKKKKKVYNMKISEPLFSIMTQEDLIIKKKGIFYNLIITL